MPKIELNLLENAVDSLNEALLKYQEGDEGNVKAYKFSILHFSHFIELIFKYYVSLSHELLIYKNPFSRNIAKEITIGVWDAVQFLKNEGHQIPVQFEDDLKWFKSLRNEIEHHKFVLDIDDAKEALGRLMQTVNEFNALVADFELKDHVDPALLESFELLADEYRAKLAKALKRAEEVGGVEKGRFCSFCDHVGTVTLNGQTYTCHFCTEKSSQVPCAICEGFYPEDEVSTWNDEHPPYVDYICCFCSERMNNL